MEGIFFWHKNMVDKCLSKAGGMCAFANDMLVQDRNKMVRGKPFCVVSVHCVLPGC